MSRSAPLALWLSPRANDHCGRWRLSPPGWGDRGQDDDVHRRVVGDGPAVPASGDRVGRRSCHGERVYSLGLDGDRRTRYRVSTSERAETPPPTSTRPSGSWMAAGKKCNSPMLLVKCHWPVIGSRISAL